MPLEDLSRLKGVRMPLRVKIVFAMLLIFHAADFAIRDCLAKRRPKRGA